LLRFGVFRVAAGLEEQLSEHDKEAGVMKEWQEGCRLSMEV
jgi:hypothetical protein